MLIDAFTFFNEYDMLEARLEYLDPVVDQFVIVECDHTHAGNPKELNFEKHMDRYSNYLHKITYLPLRINAKEYDFTKPKHTDYSAGQWVLEKQQRNYISVALKNHDPLDFVMISDVDEVPTIQSITDAESKYDGTIPGFGSSMEMFWYNFKQRETKYWSGSTFTNVRNALQFTPEWFREHRWSLPKILHGYHMTYFMEPELMKHKIENFAHQELNQSEYTNPDKLKERIAKGIEPFARREVPLVPVDINSIDAGVYKVFSRVSKT